mmetsp:Transcript_13309/g.22028  ORF Transcript_13309/g.22028 Transcript_13309/m.22028 type:complete len:113 (-) Transcript_13309:639-977(-)
MKLSFEFGRVSLLSVTKQDPLFFGSIPNKKSKPAVATSFLHLGKASLLVPVSNQPANQPTSQPPLCLITHHFLIESKICSNRHPAYLQFILSAGILAAADRDGFHQTNRSRL